MQTPDMYALEHLNDDEFWDLAFSKAFPASSARPPFAHLSPDMHSVPVASTASRELQGAMIASSMYVVCDDIYAFPLHALLEIIAIPAHLSFLPDTPSWMMGLIAWRGRILATLDLHTYLHNAIHDPHLPEHSSLLIAHHGEIVLAFAATVGQTVHLSASDTTYRHIDIAALFKDVVQHLERTISHE